MAANPLDKLNKVPVLYKAVGLAVILLGIVVYYIFVPWTSIDDEVKKLEGQKTQLERTYNEQKTVADNLPTFIENTKKLEQDLDAALKQLPRSKEVPNLLREIYTLGKKSGVIFKTFEPQAERRQKLYSELPIKLSIQGSYNEIAVFFDRIGKMSRIVNISELDVSMSSGKDKENQLSVNCVATTFMFTGGGG